MENLQIDFLKMDAVSKTDIQTAVDQLVKLMDDGNLDSVEILKINVQLKAMETFIKDALKRTADHTIDAHGKYGEKVVACLGAEMTMVSKKPTLDFDSDEQIHEFKMMTKQRKMDLQDAWNRFEKNQSELVIDGEIIPVLDLKSAGGDYIKVVFKKE